MRAPRCRTCVGNSPRSRCVPGFGGRERRPSPLEPCGGTCRATPSCSPRRSPRSTSSMLVRSRHASRASEPPLVIDVRELDEFEQGAIPGAIHVPRGRIESRIEGLVPDRDDADRPQLRVGRALGVRRPRARRPRLPQRRVAERRLRRLEVRRPRVDRAAPARRRAPRALLAPHPDPRGRRGRPAAAARLEGAPARRRRPRLALPRCTSPRPASARSASSTPTPSTPRTCSARCCTRPTGSVSRRRHRRGSRSRR